MFSRLFTRNRFSCLLLLLAGLLAGLLALAIPALAGEKTQSLDSKALEKIFHSVLLENAPWPAKDVEISNFLARPTSLNLPEGILGWQVQQRQNDSRPGRKVLSLSILVDGIEQGQVKMSGELRLFGTVIRTTRRLARNEVLTADAINLSRQDISMLDIGLLQDPAQVLGMKLKTSLAAGSILYGQFIDAPTLVNRGELVTITAQSRNIRVTVPGEAKNSGAMGEMIRVKNMMSRREIHAKVSGTGLVETIF